MQVPSKNKERYTLADLLRVMERLRDPKEGCPWDLQQDFHSIVPSTLEECYELASAIAQEDFPHVQDELGDVLFQVVFYSQLASEQSLFRFEDVVHSLIEKLLRRHPHVFANGEIEGRVDQTVTVEEVGVSWEAIKAQERSKRSLTGVLADVPLALPALSRAQKLQKRAAQNRFDWQSVDGVLEKLEEEVGELREALSTGAEKEISDEMGDVLFTAVNLARHLKLDAEATLRGASQKFQTRFEIMEGILREEGGALNDLDQQQMDVYWRRAKAQE
ncbi:MAG: nucleoside triphosphate pyrophosphohydrolase [Halioglobus sp.]